MSDILVRHSKNDFLQICERGRFANLKGRALLITSDQSHSYFFPRSSNTPRSWQIHAWRAAWRISVRHFFSHVVERAKRTVIVFLSRFSLMLSSCANSSSGFISISLHFFIKIYCEHNTPIPVAGFVLVEAFKISWSWLSMTFPSFPWPKLRSCSHISYSIITIPAL